MKTTFSGSRPFSSFSPLLAKGQRYKCTRGIFKSLFAFADSSKENTPKWESIFLSLECEERTYVCTPACLGWQQTVPGAHTLSYRLTVKSAENAGKNLDDEEGNIPMYPCKEDMKIAGRY